MADKYIKNPVKLNFDPNKITNLKTKLIFQDKTARIFYLGIKPSHTVGQYFNEHCLNASEIIGKIGTPKSPEKLSLFLGEHFSEAYSKEFVEEFFPYISGEKNLEYEVVK